MFQIELVWRYLTGGGRFVSLTSLLAFAGVVIGVACLVLTMGVISGVESLLKRSIIDVTGHFVMMERSGPMAPLSELEPKLRKILPKVTAISPYVHQEGMVAHEGRIQGIVLQGVDPSTFKKVLKLESRILKGDDKLELKNGEALIGQVLAERMKLKVGDQFKVVVAKPNLSEEADFSPSAKTFLVSSVLDMGKFDLNERLVIAGAPDVQELKGFSESQFSGFLFRFSEDEAARDAAFVIGKELGYSYFMKDWFEVNRNFFSSVQVERYAIFVVLMFLVLVACFNVCSTLFVHVLKRYSDISIFKTMGASYWFLLKLFIKHGMIVGMLGAFLGVGLGLALGFLVEESSLIYVPAEVYKFGKLVVEIRVFDLLLILGSTFFICLLSTLLPAMKGARLNPVEGLKYE
jgi:lipoprotein-releasing system permease protein